MRGHRATILLLSWLLGLSLGVNAHYALREQDSMDNLVLIIHAQEGEQETPDPRFIAQKESQ